MDWLSVIVLISLCSQITESSEDCCSFALQHRGCYTTCLETFADLAQEPAEDSILVSCPESMVQFWSCLNESAAMDETGLAAQWAGRRCCTHAWSRECRNSCQSARVKSRDDLSGCRPREDATFFQCVERHETKVECCRSGSTVQCRHACHAIFIQDSHPSRAQNEALRDHCSDDVISCVNDYLQQMPTESPTEHLPCCERTNNPVCRNSCVHALTSLSNEDAIIEALMIDCGTISFTDPVWQCFLMESTNHLPPAEPPTFVVDAAKLHCCSKAASDACQKLCVQTHGRSYHSSWERFDQCRMKPSETNLNHCLQQVDEPCTMGCTGLDYCRHFNDRPTEMFMSCNKEADVIAERTMQVWAEGVITLPSMKAIPVKDIRQCEPEAWRILACALEIKPCQSHTARWHICHTDCVKVLTQCLDYRRLESSMSVESMCNTLSPADPDLPCLSLQHYTDGSTKKKTSEVTHPCKQNPCNSSQVCLVRHRKCHHDNAHCRPYICRPACRLGEVSQFSVPRQSYVRVPSPSVNEHHCHSICRCANDGTLRHCQQMACTGQNKCLLDTGRIEEHGSRFELECKKCVCFNGEVTCTKRECSNNPYKGLPCDCDNSYEPVSGSNGVTYHNQCLARCNGVTSPRVVQPYGRGACRDSSCPDNHKCVPRAQRCLHNEHCPQYTCVPRPGHCREHDHAPVCDSEATEHVNLCALWSKGKELAYWGHCRTGCRVDGPVCGHDLVTYGSECEAWAARVAMDYAGECRVTPNMVPNSNAYGCDGVKCPPIARSDHVCKPVVPMGACCPICASEIRVLYSQNIVASSLEVIPQQPITIEDITQTLSYQLSSAECDVFGYHGIEGDLIILVVPVVSRPTHLQTEACLQEAKQLANNINNRSPAVKSFAVTSSLLSADLQAPAIYSNTASGCSYSSVALLSNCLFIVYMFISLNSPLNDLNQHSSLCDRQR